MSDNRRYSIQLPHLTQSSEPSDHLDSRSFVGNMNPSSAYLQDLLRERKASQRASHIKEQNNTNSERQVQSSPIGPSAASKPQPRKISGSMVPKEMGLREMEDVSFLSPPPQD